LTATGAHILVVDDEAAIAAALRRILTAHGFAVDVAETGAEALERCAERRPDVLILDLGLPDMDGTEVIREVRATSDTPIIILSVREAEREKVQALDLGADDYLTKPFGVDELLARVRVALRHSAHPSSGPEAIFRSGDLEVDLEQRQVTAQGRAVHLTPTEFRLLRTFLQHPGKLLTDRMLLHQVWGPDYGLQTHYLHVYMSRLRGKIEEDPERPRHLVTEPGVGYRLVTDDE
jgi:two-component system KDP operon response regulator KdpE